jgi:hypothetical protein
VPVLTTGEPDDTPQLSASVKTKRTITLEARSLLLLHSQ